MVRFNDKPLITTLSDDDIMPITDMSEPSSDKKMNMKQLSEYVANLASHDVASAFKALGTETVSSDSSAYNEILDRKHSTFDRSQFIVIGSPTISNDGIASGFSGANHFNIPAFDISKTWNINIAFTTSSDVNTLQYIFRTVTQTYGIQLVVNNGNISVAFNTSSGIKSLKYTASANTKYIGYIQWTGTEYKFSLNREVQTVASSSSISINDKYVLGIFLSDAFKGSIDLKAFSITVDGKEVFNSNKTGIDVIKEDNYQVVGSPIITDDGVASGFSSHSNYLKLYKASSLLNKSWSISVRLNGNGGSLGNPISFTNGYSDTNSAGIITAYNNGNAYLNLKTGDSTDTSILAFNNNYLISTWELLNVEIIITLSFDITTGTYTWVIKNANTQQVYNTKVYTPTSTNKQLYEITSDANAYVCINSSLSNVVYNTNETIDLNSFKIYVDGNLVYQPCLKIPYTQSKTGSKIVPAHARSRVFDLYEQTGKALYYTIDEENKNFTAPLSDIYGMITDNANLKNFTLEGKDRFKAQNAYLTGDILKEEQGLNQVKMMKRSTFDRSKFTVVGTPTITDDGMLINGSYSNHLRLSNDVFKLLNSNSWEIHFAGVLPSHTGSIWSITGVNATSNGVLNIGWINGNGNFFVQYYNSNETTEAVYIPSGNLVFGTPFKGVARYNNGLLELELENNGSVLYANKTTTTTINVTTQTLEIGQSNNVDSSIDLKQFSITVDGKEVFNGNKTGINQIKADTFTKVGSPVISADGVASNVGVADRIQIIQNIDFNKDFEIKWNMQITTEQTENNSYLVESQGNTKFQLYHWKGNTASNFYFIHNYTTIFNRGIPYSTKNTDYIFKSKNGVFSVGYKSVDDNEYTFLELGRTTETLNVGTGLYLGYSSGGARITSDLNKLKIYVDGNLVYQPTLRIPYTQSKTGSKIANIGSRDRVQDMYEQFGYAPYYTLEDDSFTLPKGEVYGLIGSRSLKSHFRSGINYCDVYSDRELEQGGACTANIAVNLLKPYEDANYVLSVPYSAKTATSFTPTTSGTWMAKGIAKSLD